MRYIPTINPLIITGSIRDFNVCAYWREQIDFYDRLEFKNYWFQDLYPFARNYFLEHDEYTHYVICAEDVIVTPDMVSLLIDDVRDHDFPVIGAVLNVDFAHDHAAISFRDLRKIVVRSREVYKHPSFKDLTLSKYGFPFVEVTFQGNALVSFRRDVVEKMTFKPYRFIQDSLRRNYFGCNEPFGIMYDLRMCNEIRNMGIRIVVDLRLIVMHFAFGASVINFAHKPRKVTLYRKDGTQEVLRRDPPYMEKPYEPKKVVRKKLTREEFRRAFIGEPKRPKR